MYSVTQFDYCIQFLNSKLYFFGATNGNNLIDNEHAQILHFCLEKKIQKSMYVYLLNKALTSLGCCSTTMLTSL